VWGLSPSCAAICLLLRPSATSRRTSDSRGLRRSSAGDPPPTRRLARAALLRRGPEPPESLAREVELRLRGLLSTERAQRRSECDACPRRLEREPCPSEQLDGVLERLPRARDVAGGRAGAPLGVTRRAEQRLGARPVGDRAQLARGVGRVVLVRGRLVGLGEQLERRCPLRPRVADQPQIACGVVDRGGEVAAPERDRGPAEQREGVVLGPAHQRERLGRAALAASELRETRERLGPLRRADCEDRHGLRQLDLRARPLAAQQEDGSVVGAAHGAEGADVPARGHPCHALAPLPGALEVTHALAREDQVAAREADRDRVSHLPGRRRRRRLVEARHPRCHVSLADASQAVQRDRGHLEVDVLELTPERLGLRAAREHRRGLARERERRLAQRDPAALGRRTALLEEPARPGQPPVSDRPLAPEDAVVPGERGRHPCRVDRSPCAPVCAVRALSRREGRLALVEEERGGAEALESLGRLLVLESLREERSGRRPVGVAQRPARLREQVPGGGRGGIHPCSLAQSPSDRSSPSAENRPPEHAARP
jgi:hypothetical protein